MTFHDVAWTIDTTVNGTTTSDSDTGAISASLTVTGPRRLVGRGLAVISRLRYPLDRHDLRQFGDQPIVATMPAP